VDVHQVEEEFEAALEDAALSHTECFVRLTDRSPTDTGLGAQWFQPGMTIDADANLVTEELAAELNSRQHRHRHRVIVRRPLTSIPVSIAAFSGKLRHELEHARQWNACGLPVFQLSEVADWVLARKVAGLPGGRVFTNLKPIEQDANAASALFLSRRMPDAIESILNDPEHAPLARSLTPPGSPETLVTRMVAFLYLFEDLCSALEATWAIGFAEHLDQIAPGAGALWQTLKTSLAAPAAPADTI
jgi:hypothetical protein